MDKFKFKFSIVMPVYNTEKYLGEAVESVIQQDIGFKENVQLILVDDGSKDKSGAICDSYSEKFPENIIVIHKENGGVSSARNVGLSYAEGRYLNFLDSDDKFTVNTLSEVYNFFVNNEEETDVVTTPMRFFGAQNNEHYLNYKFQKGNRIINLQEEYDAIVRVVAPSFFTNRCKDFSCFDEKLIFGEDIKFIMSVIYRKMKLGVVGSCRYLYRKRLGGELSSSGSAIRNPVMYFDYFTDLVDWSINFHLDKLGFVPGYIQYTNMLGVAWRFKNNIDISKILTAEGIEEYKKILFGSLKDIDDIYILSQRILDIDFKNFILSKKYGCSPQITPCEYDAAVHYGDSFVCHISDCYIRIESIKYKDNVIYLKGFTKILGVSNEETIDVYVFCNDKKIECNMSQREDVNTIRFGEVVSRGIGFECQIPAIDVKGSIKIGINFRGIEIISKNINFNKSIYITKNNKNSYYYTKGLLVVLNGNAICWSKCTSIGRLGQEFLLLKEIWQGGKNGKGKAVARLNDNFKKLLHKVIS